MSGDSFGLENSSFTLEQIVNSGKVLDFDWSPRGDKLVIAWKRQGKTQLYLLDPEGSCPRLLTTNEVSVTSRGDGGPVWSPDGDCLAYVSLVGGYRNLWLVSTTEEMARPLTSGPQNDFYPSWSPDGRYLAFVTDRWGDESLVIIDRHGKLLFRLTEKYLISEPTWSPDGRNIAVVVSNENQPGSSVLALINLTESKADLVKPWAALNELDHFSCPHIQPTTALDFLTPWDGSRDRSPRWSPDSKRIAFISDRSGFAEVWEITLPERDMRLLFQNRGEKEEIAWSSDGIELAFVENENGNLNLGVFNRNTQRVRFIRRGPQVIFRLRWSPDGRCLAYLEEKHNSPAELWLSQREEPDWSQRRLTWSTPLGLEEKMKPEPRAVSYQSFDGLEINAWLYQPSLPGRHPAIVYLHGGPSSQFTNGWEPFLQYLVARGYVVLAPNYRGSTGYGRAFQELNDGDWGGNDLQDVLFAARYLQAQEFVDPKRIGVFGESYGGYLTLLALAKAPGVFRAGIDLYGVSNRITAWLETDKIGRLNMLKEMGPLATNRELYEDRSAVNFVSQVEAPLLILHGEADKRVPPGQSREMADALRKHDKFFLYHTYPDEGHGFEKLENLLDCYTRIEKFLANFL